MHKIAFLFLTVASVYHEKLWESFFKTHKNKYTVYVHSKYALPDTSFFKPYELPVKIPTRWERTMRAQLELLKYALQDRDNYKFIFVSESTLPLCSFKKIYKKFTRHPLSEFNYIPNPHTHQRSRNLLPIEQHYQYKNSQWILLNRKHAELMVQDKQYIAIITRYFADNEHYPSTFLAIHNLLGEVVKQDRTFVYWPRLNIPHPYTFKNINSHFEQNLLNNALENNYLFARKFTQECDISYIHMLTRKQ